MNTSSEKFHHAAVSLVNAGVPVADILGGLGSVLTQLFYEAARHNDPRGQDALFEDLTESMRIFLATLQKEGAGLLV